MDYLYFIDRYICLWQAHAVRCGNCSQQERLKNAFVSVSVSTQQLLTKTNRNKKKICLFRFDFQVSFIVRNTKHWFHTVLQQRIYWIHHLPLVSVTFIRQLQANRSIIKEIARERFHAHSWYYFRFTMTSSGSFLTVWFSAFEWNSSWEAWLHFASVIFCVYCIFFRAWQSYVSYTITLRSKAVCLRSCLGLMFGFFQHPKLICSSAIF